MPGHAPELVMFSIVFWKQTLMTQTCVSCLQFSKSLWRSLFYWLFTCWCSWVSVVYHTSCIRKVKRPSFEAPRGSKISVKEEAGELRILFPPPSWSSLVGPGTFTVAWVTFTAVWTAGVVSAGAPLMSLFSLLTGMQVIFAMAISSPVTLYGCFQQ